MSAESPYSCRLGVEDNVLVIRLAFPFLIGDWALGNSAITPYDAKDDAGRLKAYEQMFGERARITELVRAAMPPLAEDCYRVMREVDAEQGTNKVEGGIAKPFRPQPFESGGSVWVSERRG